MKTFFKTYRVSLERFRADMAKAVKQFGADLETPSLKGSGKSQAKVESSSFNRTLKKTQEGLEQML